MTYAINGTEMPYINTGNWVDRMIDNKLSGNLQLNKVRGHIWRGSDMPTADYDLLYALEGKEVSIVTSDYNQRNFERAYHAVKIKRVQGTQQDINFHTVQVDFNVVV